MMASEALIKKAKTSATVFGLLTKNALSKIKKAASLLEFDFEFSSGVKDNRQFYFDNEADFLGLERRMSFA